MSRAASILLATGVVALVLAGAAVAEPMARLSGPRPELVEQGLAAYGAAQAAGRIRNPVLTLIDYALPSSERRLFVLEPDSGRIVFREFVAHGRGSTDPGHP